MKNKINLNQLSMSWNEKQKVRGMRRYAVLLLLLLTCVIQVFATDMYVPHLLGDWNKVDKQKLIDRGSNVHSAYFALSTGEHEFKINDGNWGNDNTYNRGKNDSSQPTVGTAYDLKQNGDNMKVNITTAGLYLFSVNISTWKLTITLVEPTAAAPSAVISGTNKMFYIQGYDGANYLVKGKNNQTASTSYPLNNNGLSYVNTAADLTQYYYISNNPSSTDWDGDANNNIKSANGGEYFNRDGTATQEATLSTHTASVSSNTLTIVTKTSKTTSSYASAPLYIQYYIDGTFTGVTYNASTASYASIKATGNNQTSTYNCSSLSNGSHTLKTVLTDGIVYYVAASDNFTVAHTYTVTYKDEGNVKYTGSNEASLPTSYTYGTGIPTLTDGVKADYTFVGWYTNSTCTEGPVTTIANDAEGNKTFYAKWLYSATTYGVTYYGNTNNSGTAPTDNTAYSPNASVTVKGNRGALEKNNCTFSGWNTQANGLGTDRAANSTFNITADVDLYAKWTTSVYFVDYNSWNSTIYAYAWEGSGGTGHENAPFASAPAMTDMGKTYNGKKIWKIDNILGTWSNIIFKKDGSNKTGDLTFTPGKMMPDGNDNNWRTLAYDVTLDRQTGTSGTSSIIAECGSAMPSDKTKPSKTGYTFGGYYTAIAGGGTQYYTNAMASANTWPSDATGPTTLYAKWTQSCTLNQNGATTNGTGSVTTTYNSSSIAAIINPSKIGNYTFGGWYSANDGSGYEVINTSGALQSNKSGWTDGSGQWTHSGSATLYAKWTQSVTLDYNSANHGSGSNKSATINWNATGVASITPCTPATGYNLDGYYTAATDGTKILNADGTFAGSNIVVSGDTYIDSNGKWVHAGATTLYAQYTPQTTTVTLNNQGATEPGTEEVTATYDAPMPDITCPEKTGYNFGGYWGAPGGSGPHYYNSDGSSAQNWNQTSSTYTLLANWTAKNYTVTIDKQIGAAGYGGNAGTIDNQSVTYNTALPSVTGTAPTAATGYKFVGFYTQEGGEGVKLINANKTWVTNVDGYTSADSKWVHDGAITLYAYYQKAEITNLVVEPSIVEPGEEVVVTPTISPIPEGTTEICWQVQYTSGTPLPTQPEFIQGPDNSIFFSTEYFASATYQVEAKLRVGSTCNAGTVLSTATQTFQVAGRHNVTVQYKCGSEVIQAASTVTAEPLEWTEISAPDIFGYSFNSWTVGDGITLQSSTGTKDNKIKAVYGGILTANYTKDKKIFFKNTLGWDAPFVYFYKDGGYWDVNTGAGCDGDACLNKKYAHAMINISGTDIWYFDYSGTGFANQVTRYVAFTWGNRSDNVHFTGVDVVYGTSYSYGYSQGTPMFVPLSKSEQSPDNVNGASYYSKGYWTNYLGQETGYELRIYDSSNNLISSKTQKFTSADKLMAMKATVNLDAGVIYKFEILRNDGMYYGNTGTMSYSNENQDWKLTYNAGKCSIQTAAAGDYTFTLTYSSQDLYIAVDYPSTVGDFRLLYKDQADASYWSSGSAHTAAWGHPSRVVSKVAGAEDIVSFFVVKGASATLQFQHITSINAETGAVSWTNDGSAINIDNTYNLETGVYNFYLKQSDPAGTIEIEKVEPYTGDFYIRTKNANNGWDNYIANDHMIMYSNYAETNHNYTHYWMKYVSNGSDIKFCVANDYSPCISDTLSADVGSSPVTTTGGMLSTSEEGVNIRHMWNKNTNTLSRAYLTGPVSNQYLLLRSERTVNSSDNRLFKSWTSTESNTRLNHASFTENATSYDLDTLLFKDNQNWVYQLDVYARPSATYKLTALVNGNTTFLRGLEGNYTTEGNIETLIGGNKNSTTAYHVRMIYDFKNDRMVKAWMPSGEVSGELPINADIMIVREHQNAGQQITFANEDSKLSKVHTVYGVMRFNRWTLNNKEKDYPHDIVGDPKSRFERGLYWISFPFDVNLSDVFGFGTYGVDWIIEYYDGEGRATSGYWIDSPSFWRYVMPSDRADFVLKAGKGYVLALELDNMKDNNSSFWSNNIEQVELFFPSAEFVSNIKETNVTTTAHTHACSIDRTNGGAYDINQNRTIADSHWNMIGVPSYANYGEELTSDGSTTIEWATPTNSDLPYLYEWNMVDNTYTVQTGTTYPFKSMHSYMVQYHGEMHWALASATDPSVAARRNAEGVQDVEFRMEIQQDEKMIDQTFVRMSNDAEVSASFKFDEDLFKEFNKNKANIYTYIENYIPAAGNILPTSEQTTLVPVGVKVPANGEYMFAIPDGTQGVGVTLIDNETGARTSLSALEYSIYLTAGDHNERFMLEISPISSMPTEVEEVTGDGLQVTGIRKVIIDGVMYIIREGKIYDARGARVE